MSFNPLDHPIMYSYPDRYVSATPAWAEHIPLAMLLIDLLRPRVFVELGTHYGVSYCAFCQAVKALDVRCQCSAVDTWHGDEHAGVYGDEVLRDLKSHHDPRYGAFSRLLQMTFDEARSQFPDGSIDLLHIDGYHTYEAVKQDFEAWRPKMSERGVVVFHDIAERTDDFGVWKLWDELTSRYPLHLSLTHGHGLGILAVGEQVPEQARSLFTLSDVDKETFRALAHSLGARITSQEELRQLQAEEDGFRAAKDALERQVGELSQALATASTQREYLERDHTATVAMEAARANALEEAYANAQEYISQLESSRGVRAVKLARASRAVLRHKGPVALAKHAALWASGRRGYFLRDLQPQTERVSLSDALYHAWRLGQRTIPSELQAQRAASEQFTLRPLISFVVPVFNPDPAVLEETIASVLEQTYEHWELCLVDGGSTRVGVHDVLHRHAAQDLRIRVTFLTENKGIAGNSNAAVEMARGEFVTLLDHDDLIEPDLLYQVVATINSAPDVDMVYYDENRVSAEGDRYFPIMVKPAWSPELLLSTPFATHATIRRQLLLAVGGFDPAADGTQDWDLFLRLSEHTQNVVRIPRFLYHWRMVSGSAAADVDAKPHVFERQLAAIRNHMARVTGQDDVAASWAAPGVPRVTWTPQPTHVSIIIPTKDNVAVLRRCVESILRRTAYRHFDIVLVDTGSVERATWRYYAALEKDKRATIKIVRYEGDFNYSRACNIGARNADGASLLFMNNDMEVMDADWLEELVRWSNLPEIGVVGAKLMYPTRRIQHAGVIIGAAGLAGHIYYDADEHATSLLGSVDWYRNYLAVTGALHMMRREVYDAVGGYDESYDISYSDVALCYQAVKQGYRVLYDPFVQLIHYESQTRDRTPSLHDQRIAAEELLPAIEGGDPYFSPHLSYQQSMPTLRHSGEPTPVQLLEQLLDRPGEEGGGPSTKITAEPEAASESDSDTTSLTESLQI